MRVLVITRIFPNSVEPLAAPFNRQQLAALRAHCELGVISPLPWFPGVAWTNPWLRAGRLTRASYEDSFDGVPATFPRGLYLPRLGASLSVPLLYASLRRTVLAQRGRWDVVLGSWLYPDACAALWLAKDLGLPCVVKAHGSDVNRIAQRRDVLPIVRAFLPRAAAAVAPSRALVDKLVGLGARRDHAHHVPNGVDRAVFHVSDRADARRALGYPLERKLILFVGRLDPEKGVRELLRAHEALGGVGLCLVGDGPLRSAVDEAAARSHGAVIAPGAVPLPDVAKWLAAADVVALPSYAEGTPNTVLEALACGRPVVASHVGGIPDVLEEPTCGHLIPPRDADALARALAAALGATWNANAIASSGPMSWTESAAALHHVLDDAVLETRCT